MGRHTFSASSRCLSSDVIFPRAIVGSLGPPTPAKRYCGFCNATKFTNEMIENLNDEIRNGKIIYLISGGIVGKTVNVKFVEE
jgi:hypothetical protein